ncbi:DUF424 family protein [archaeon]|jgi:hypothetical protein|nr:DUF424 family protein [archaeon]MBT3577395.1 DUF424 family protein [archaeon]MBT6820362.1 DUF424 family protein [archaeon]MBT6956405.1 DUF424 family protein [archaeon]MBT7025176.1 DUF424 family protein [archaeon]
MEEEKSILINIHKSYRPVVAICDKELYGKKLIDDPKQLDLTGPFFKGEEKTQKEVQQAIIDYNQEDATFNIVGERSIEVAKNLGLVKDEGITDIDGIPLALVLL